MATAPQSTTEKKADGAFLQSLFLTKKIEVTAARRFKPVLGSWSLVEMGIGAIIGAGLFVRTADAIANNAGPAVTLSFVLASIGCAFAGLCYAEFASMIPSGGSAYEYSYTTMGELIAWIIGWDLVLEYAVGAAVVAISWSQYFNKVLGYIHTGLSVPYQWSHSPFETGMGANAGIHGIMNIPAGGILLLISLLLIWGTKEAAWANRVMVIVKVAIVLLVITIGWGFIDPANHNPYIPAPRPYTPPDGFTGTYGGMMGILGGAGIVFFAFIGFDAVSAMAQDAKKPKRDVPIGILGSLVICTILYIAFSYVLSGVATVEDFRTTGKEASVAFVISKYMRGYQWLAQMVSFCLLAGFSSVMLVMLLGQSRVFEAMSKDGLVPKVFSELHPRFNTPWKSHCVFFVFTALFAAFLPENIVGDMTSVGTLLAFILVCAGVWILRKRRPDLERAFTVPALPVVSTLGIVVCALMIYGRDWTNWLRVAIWLVIGLIFYAFYGRRHSRLRRKRISRETDDIDGNDVGEPRVEEKTSRNGTWEERQSSLHLDR